MKGWLTCLHECVFTLDMNMSKAKGIFTLGRYLCFSGESGEGGAEEGVSILSAPNHLKNFPLNVLVTEPWLQIQWL